MISCIATPELIEPSSSLRPLFTGCSWGTRGSRGARAARRLAERPAPSAEYTTSSTCPTGIAAATATTVVWPGVGKIISWDTASASVPEVVTETEGARAVALHGDSIFWIDAGDGGDGQPTIRRVAREGGPSTKVATAGNQTRLIAAGPRGIYWVSRGVQSRPTELWALVDGQRAASRLGDANPLALSLHVTAEYAYWHAFDAQAQRSAIERFALRGGDREIVASFDPGLQAFAADGRGLAWIERGTKMIVVAAPDGDQRRGLATLDGVVLELMLTDDAIFVFDGDQAKAVSRLTGEVTLLVPRSPRSVGVIRATPDRVFIWTSHLHPHGGCRGSQFQALPGL